MKSFLIGGAALAALAVSPRANATCTERAQSAVQHLSQAISEIEAAINVAPGTNQQRANTRREILQPMRRAHDRIMSICARKPSPGKHAKNARGGNGRPGTVRPQNH